MMAFFTPRPTATGAPYLRHFWSGERISMLILLGLLPPLIVTIVTKGLPFIIIAAVAILVALAWQVLFCLVRKQRIAWDGISFALMFALIAGDTVPLGQLVLSVSFGIVVGELIFGGRGFGFLNPAVVALAFLTFSFAGTGYADPTIALALATLPAALALLLLRMISWRLLVGMLVALAGFGLLRGQVFDAALFNGSFLFITIFLACDPVTTAATNLGRWVNGALIGGLAWAFVPADGLATQAEALIPAILMASVFAPLIDTLVVLLNRFVRGRRNA